MARFTARLDRQIATGIGRLAPYETRLLAWCDTCSWVIARAESRDPVPVRYWLLEPTGAESWRIAAEFADWSDLAAGSGDHRHDLPGGDIRFYAISPVGPIKYEKYGTWADVAEAIPYFLREGSPIPSRRNVSKMLARGARDAGMSGGAEWPPHELSEDEYAQMRATLLNRSGSQYLSVEIPDTLTLSEAEEFVKRHPEVARYAAKNCDLAPDTVRGLSTHEDRNVRRGVALRDDLPDDIVTALLTDADQLVRAITSDKHGREDTDDQTAESEQQRQVE